MRAQNNAAYHVRGTMLSDVGSVRVDNEDRAAYMLPGRDEPTASRGALALIADGMGGHAAGEVASQLAAEVVLSTYYASPAAPGEALAEGIQAANTAIYQEAQRRADCHGMGTTCIAVALFQGRAYLGNVGDSRAYLLRNESLYQLSEDHSLVMELVRTGAITREEAEQRTDRNVLIRALGTHPKVEVAVWPEGMPVRNGDVLMLCSDGLSDVVAESVIRDILLREEPNSACRALIQAAIDAGGVDNITVGVFVVSDQPVSRVRPIPRTRAKAAEGSDP